MKGKHVKQINNLVITQYTRKDGKPCFDIYTKQKEYITTVPNLDYAKRICEGCATYLVRKIMLKDLTTNSLILIEKELQKAHISYESVGTQGSNLLSVELFQYLLYFQQHQLFELVNLLLHYYLSCIFFQFF